MSRIFSLLIVFFAFSLVLFESKNKNKTQRKPFYFVPSHLIKHFSFGFPDLYADILWMRLIQDIDFCSSKKGLPIYDGKTNYQCQKGWSYKMTNAITELAPRFLKPYEISAPIMSIIMGDKQGAKKIYDKGIKNFPTHWNIHFSAGYHYLIELNERNKAAKLLTQAADLGGPHWLYILTAKIYEEMGRLILSREILQESIKKNMPQEYKKTLEFKLQKIKKKIKQLQTSL